MATAAIIPQTPAEERWNALTHGLGVLLSAAGLTVLVTLATIRGETIHIVTAAAYGSSLLLLYLASTLFHACPPHRLRAKHALKVADHAAIYCLIAGTYTPFLLVNIRGAWGWSLFGVVWGLAVIGIVFKLFFTRLLMIRWVDVASSLLYLAMGWVALVGIKPFWGLPGGLLAWILVGGALYTVGVVFYLWDSMPFNHVVWHLFVLGGSVCHYFGVLKYSIP